MNSINRNLLLYLKSFLLLVFFTSAAQSAILIDDFTTVQNVFNNTSGPINITSGTQLSGLTRTLIADLPLGAPADAEVEIKIGNGRLSIINDFGAIGPVSILYSFESINLATLADGFILAIDYIDLNSEIQMIANETSVFGFVNTGGGGLREIEFTNFLDDQVFTQLTSLRLNFRGAQDWDGRFGPLLTNSQTVPEPSTMLLVMLGIAVLGKSKAISSKTKVFNKVCQLSILGH